MIPPLLPRNYGTGLKIADGLILTAGHVVFEFDRAKHAGLTLSNIISTSNIPTLGDLRGYQIAYLAQASNVPLTRARDPNTTLEAHIFSKDIVVIQKSGNMVGSNDSGLVRFVNYNDLASTANLTAGTTTWRDGNTTNAKTSIITDVFASGYFYFSGAIDNYQGAADEGDSGAPYYLHFDGKDYALGSHSSQIGTESNGHVTPTGAAIGEYFTDSDWGNIHNILQTNQSSTNNITAESRQTSLLAQL